MDSLCNYGSDDDRSQSKSSYNAPSDWQTEQDVNYEPVTMDMSEDSNEEEYYARKYGKYDEVAAAAKRRNFDPYEDDVSDAPTSPEPDPPTGSHVRDPSNGSAHESHETANQNRGYEHDRAHQNREYEHERANQNQGYEHDRANQNRGYDHDERDRANRDYRREEEREKGSANQNRDYRREEDRDTGSTNQDRDYRREGGVKEEVARQYGSYYERAKQKLSGEDTEETDGDERERGHQNGKSSSEKAGGFPTYKGDTRRDRHDKDRSHHDRDRHDEKDRSHRDEKDRSSRRERSRERDHKSSSKHSSSRHRDKSREKEKRHEKDRRKRSRSRSRDKYERKSSRRHKSRSHSRSHSRSRSSSKSRSHHASSSRHRRGHSSSSRRRSRESSIGDLPRPYAPYERKPSKLQILEKLGIELKVPPSTQAPPTPGASAPPIPSLLGISTVNPLTGQAGPGLLGAGAGPTGGGVTPQDVLQKTIAAQMEKIRADTGIELPKYYNPMAINPSKYAEQIQKRRLLWGNKVVAAAPTAPNSSAPTVSTPVSTPAAATATTTGGGTIWQGATFSGDQDGRMTSKFQRLMGIKNATGGAASTPGTGTDAAAASSSAQPAASKSAADVGTDLIRKQEEMFHSMESQYEAARMATHTHRGLGLGFGTFAPR